MSKVGAPKKYRYGSSLITLRLSTETFSEIEKLKEFNPLATSSFIVISALESWVKKVYPLFPATEETTEQIKKLLKANSDSLYLNDVFKPFVNLKEDFDTRKRPLKKLPIRLGKDWLDKLQELYCISKHNFWKPQGSGLIVYLSLIIGQSVTETLSQLEMQDQIEIENAKAYEKALKKAKRIHERNREYNELDPIYKTKNLRKIT